MRLKNKRALHVPFVRRKDCAQAKNNPIARL
jgi:hypothetical protein